MIGQRERLLRQANVIASPSHHDVPSLPEVPEAPEASEADQDVAALTNLFTAAEKAGRANTWQLCLPHPKGCVAK